MSFEALAAELADRYRFERELGRGGMAVVFLAYDVKHSRQVAVKVLKPEFGATAFADRFFREIAIAARLSHPNILPLHDSGEGAGYLYYVTPFLEGESLRAWLRRAGRLPLDAAVRLAGEVADALDYAHRHGVIHRDIKPDNILISDGHAIVADFGIATALAADQGDHLTSTGLVLGSPGYMSPEQSIGGSVDARSDIYSLACVLFESLTGELASAASLGSVAGTAGAKEVARRLQATQPTIPRHIAAAIQQALAPLPTDRPARADDFKRAIVGESNRGRRQKSWWVAAGVGAALLVAAVVVTQFRPRTTAEPHQLEFAALTNFADAATSPALSPDGRMLAFIRGSSTFYGPGQIYVKLLPDGEPVRLTNDSVNKMGPKFTPDGARITYTAFGGLSLDTWIVPALGGQPPRLLLTNAEGLSWFDERPGQPRVIFSEMTGRDVQMAIATSTESRGGHRFLYMPPETGMAHRSHVSPDRRSIIVSGEMDYYSWLPCRLVAFDSGVPAKVVGPSPAQCTDAAWSPDGKWMYFTANTGKGSHIWRQRFPDGMPDQLTRAVTEEEGIAFAPDGRSFLTSVGTRQSTVWVHSATGDRQISSEGYAMLPSISPDGKKVYYLARANAVRSFVSGALWVVDLATGDRQRLLPDFLMQHYAISPDGKRVVFVAADDSTRSPIWIAPLDTRAAPRRLRDSDGLAAYADTSGGVTFVARDGRSNFLYRINQDGSGLQKLMQAAMLLGITPDGQWAVTWRPPNSVVAYPKNGSTATLVCESCSEPTSFEGGPWSSDVSWSADGKFFYIKFATSVYSVPLQQGRALPPIPAGGFRSEADVAAVPGARRIAHAGAFPGPDPSVYAFIKVTTQRNIYRVQVP